MVRKCVKTLDGGWVGGWMDGWDSRVKDCLQQSKMSIPGGIQHYKNIHFWIRVFDCCKQSLTRLSHPSSLPSIQHRPRYFLPNLSHFSTQFLNRPRYFLLNLSQFFSPYSIPTFI